MKNSKRGHYSKDLLLWWCSISSSGVCELSNIFLCVCIPFILLQWYDGKHFHAHTYKYIKYIHRHIYFHTQIDIFTNTHIFMYTHAHIQLLTEIYLHAHKHTLKNSYIHESEQGL